MQDIITIGSAVRDVFLMSDQFIALESDQFPTGVGECVALGSKIELENIIFSTGGGATNAAASFGSLGFKTAAICNIGDDSPGRDVIEDLKRFGVSPRLVNKKKGHTGYSTLLTMKDGERTVLVYRGVSSKFASKDIPFEMFKRTKWIYLTSLGGNMQLSKRVIREAHKAGAKIMWNPGSRELKAGITAFKPLLSKIDILNMNREEAEMLTGKSTLEEMFAALASKDMIRLITDGTKGAYASDGERIIHAGTTDAKAISRTGAGDAFGAGVLAGLIQTTALEEALQIGTLNAESVIQKHGAKNGILARWPSKAKKKEIEVKIA